MCSIFRFSLKSRSFFPISLGRTTDKRATDFTALLPNSIFMARTSASTSPLTHALQHAARLGPAKLVQELNAHLGLKLTAAIGKASNTGKVLEWSKGTSSPRRVAALQAALQATYAIAGRFDDVAARAWFMSTNPALGMCSPLVFIRKAKNAKEYELLVTCAVQDAS